MGIAASAPQTSRVPLPTGASIEWYRTKLPPGVSEAVHAKSDILGAVQVVGWLGMLAAAAASAVRFHSEGRPWLSLLFVMLYGMQANFAINGMHELGHGHVFRTVRLNGLFLRLISFIGVLHPDMFFSSHLRHHRYTQHAPLDLENPMPLRITLRGFLLFGFVNLTGMLQIWAQTLRAAFGLYPTGHLGWLPEWEAACYPPELPEARDPARRWAQLLVLGHAAVAAASLATAGEAVPYLVPFLLSCGPFLNGWLFFLCNSTQHVGLTPGTPASPVADFRLNSRTFRLVGTPVLGHLVEFWYWQMNYHIEHHMYAAVPCYRLSALHEAIQHDLPPTPNGLRELWVVICNVLARQAADPSWVQPVALPSRPAKPKAS